MHENNRGIPQEELQRQRVQRLRTRLNAVFTGAMIGVTASLTAESLEMSAGIGSYLIARQVVHRYLEDKPMWLATAVDVGMAVPPLLILDVVIQQMDKLQPLFDQIASLYDLLMMPEFVVELVRAMPDLMQTAPELATYLLFFFLFTQETWVRLARSGMRHVISNQNRSANSED